MLDLEQLQNLAQIVDNMDVLIEKLEKAYSSNDSEEFNKSKKTIFEGHKKISQIIES